MPVQGAFEYSVTPFEHYMMSDDSESYPTNTIWRFHFSSLLNPSLFEDAVESSLTRHPLLNSTLSDDPSSRRQDLRWVFSANKQLPIIWCIESLAETMAKVRPIDLTVERAFRFYIHLCEGKTTVTLQTAHAATDGQGVLSFMNDILRAYAGAVPQPLCDVDLDIRNNFDLRTRDRLKLLPRQMLRTSAALRRRPYPIWSPNKPDSCPALIPFRGASRIELEQHELRNLKQNAKRHGASINDWLLFALFKTLKSWNEQGDARPEGIRIAMPTNLRRNLNMPAANVVSMCFIHRYPDEIDSRGLLTSITKETAAIKSGRLGLTLVSALSFLSKINRGKAFDTGNQEKCHSSAVLTNLGSILSTIELERTDRGCIIVGENLFLESVEVYTLVRPTTHMSFGILTYGGKLSINLAYNRNVLDQDYANQVLQQLKSLLLQ